MQLVRFLFLCLMTSKMMSLLQAPDKDEKGFLHLILSLHFTLNLIDIRYFRVKFQKHVNIELLQSLLLITKYTNLLSASDHRPIWTPNVKLFYNVYDNMNRL